jgi:hypothetical protein
MSGLAAVFVCLQWWEMHTGSADTKNLAAAAGTQATWTKNLATKMQTQPTGIKIDVGKISQVFEVQKGLGGFSLVGVLSFSCRELLTSGHLFIGLGIVAVAVVFNVFVFCREICLFGIVHPRTTGTIESPLWLYVFGLLGS